MCDGSVCGYKERNAFFTRRLLKSDAANIIMR